MSHCHRLASPQRDGVLPPPPPSCRMFCPQHGRCTVGVMNWVPRHISSDAGSSLSISIAGDERRTALHELMHLLGFQNPAIGALLLLARGSLHIRL